MKFLVCSFITVSVLATAAFAEKAEVKIKDLSTSSGKAIVIQEGKLEAPTSCVQYDMLDGREEVFGSPEFDRSKAYASWKAACNEWKAAFKEMNKDNRVITLNCNAPTGTKENDQHSFKSQATYKVRIKMKDKE